MTDRIIETARLQMRPCAAADAAPLHALWTQPDVRRYLWDDLVIARTTADEAVARSEADFAAHGFGHWMVRRRETDALVGGCGLRGMNDTGDVELLYALAPESWGQGYATEAARAVLAYAFTDLAYARVYGRTDTPNLASQRVLQRLGMTCEGETLHNDLPTTVYVLTRDAFDAHR